MTAPTCVAEAMKAIYASGAKLTDGAVLGCMVVDGDWRNPAGWTGIPCQEIADNLGAARGTVAAAIDRMKAAGVVVEKKGRGRCIDRRVDWDALALYQSPETKRGGYREKKAADALTVEGAEIEHSGLVNDDQTLSNPKSISAQSMSKDSAPVFLLHHVSTDKKKTRARKADTEANPADVDAVIDSWARVCPRTEKQAQRMRASQPVRRQIAAAIERDGSDAVKLRFAYIAGGPGGQAEWARGCIANEARPMQIDALLRDPSRQDRNKGGPPWVASVDGEAVDWSERIKDDGGVDSRALAVEAWANMTFDVRWKHVVQRPPNLVGDFGNPDRWDLADTAPEHDRRMACFKAAGSIPKWRDADLEGRRQFRERWLELYAKEVTA